jgi:hypothetical protein
LPGQSQVLFGSVSKEEDLKVKGPRPHIAVKVRQVRIIGHRLECLNPAQSFTQFLGQRRLSGANIPRHEHKALRH